MNAFPSYALDAGADFGVPDLTGSLRTFLMSLTGKTSDEVDLMMLAGMEHAALLKDAAPSLGDSPLTEVERTVLSLAAGGLTGQQIADYTHRAYETVKDHSKSIRRKFGVSSFPAAVTLGLVTGQIDTEQTVEALTLARAA